MAKWFTELDMDKMYSKSFFSYINKKRMRREEEEAEIEDKVGMALPWSSVFNTNVHYGYKYN